jgi:hypothetical protein
MTLGIGNRVWRGRWTAAALLIGCAAVVGCGKKGPPLAPIVRIPDAVAPIEARRIGSDVYVTLTIPTRNIDKSMPADVSRVDVYGYTGLTPPGVRFLEGATLVAAIPVAPALRRDRDDDDENDRRATTVDATSAPRSSAAQQGLPVTIRDTIEGEELEPRTLPPPVERSRRRQAPEIPALAEPVGPLRRFYLAIAVSDRERTSPRSEVISLELGPLPEPPAMVAVEYTSEVVRLAWEPSGGLIGFILGNTLPPEPSPVEEDFVVAPAASASAAVSAAVSAPPSNLPPGPTRYNVYREIAPDPLVLPDGPPRGEWQAELPRPVNLAPIAALTFEDLLTFDERQRCYLVRAVRGAGPDIVESDPSERFCFTPVDTVPPEVPAGLVAEPDPGAISLIWDPNIEEDLAGYLVLRGAPGDATLTSLTDTPIAISRFVDRTVVPGTRYVYAVVAVDSRVPLGNTSAESTRIEVTAQ